MPALEVIDLDGPVHYADYGGDGPLMVLVHGLGGSHLNWLHVGHRLAERHRVLAPDLAGFGLTPPAGRRTTVQANQRLLAEFMDATSPGEPVVLVGNSMGGLISILQAAAHPTRIAALALINPALPLADTGSINVFTLQRLFVPLIPGVGEAAMGRYYARVDPEQQLDETLAAVTADPSTVPRAGRAANLEMIRLRKEMDWAVPSFLQASRSIARVLARRRTFVKTLESIACPVMLVHGEEDRIVSPASAQWAHQHRPDWRLELMPGVGHVPQAEAPDRLVALIEHFLA
ncbi:MAG: alpha/beta fold hydrolase [Acidimicrobiia bacterium]|nr:alpha/beta fold hydrolase [Acidimicrobiia bacterium]